MNERLVEPKQGEPLSAARMKELMKAVRSQRVRVRDPLTMTQGPDGVTIGVKMVKGGGAAVAQVAGCWEIGALTKESITLVNCHFMRGPLTIFGKKELSAELSGTDDLIVSAKIDTLEDTAELVVGRADLLGVGTSYHEKVEDLVDILYVLLPLYMVGRESGYANWEVKVDLRNMPQLGVMV